MDIDPLKIGDNLGKIVERENKRQESEHALSIRTREADLAPEQLISMSAAQDTADIQRAYAQNRIDLIRTRGSIEKDRMLAIAKERAELECLRRQSNLAAIAKKALLLLKQSEKESSMIEGIDDDWWAKYCRNAEDSSDPCLQQIWARTLKNEIERPGSVSVHTIKLINSLNKKDAELIAKFFSYVAMIRVDENKYGYPDNRYIAMGITRPKFVRAEINSSDLLLLRDIGVIVWDESMKFSGEASFELDYFDRTYRVNTPNFGYGLTDVNLTIIGVELLKICDRQPVEGLMEFMLQEFKGIGVSIAGPLPPWIPTTASP
ncbi:hypothetical protein DB346_11710 [Verrucomicrobia bacterium LW23]|nr:hypothetical protein DB346_11710 [Verrucomicrobia bacterium LW23]